MLLNENLAGEIRIGYMSATSQTTENKPEGVLITLKFKVISGKQSSTDISLEATTLKKHDGTDISANIRNGKLRIISGIKLNNTSLDLRIGDTSLLTVTTLPFSIDIPKEKIIWESANPSIATINSEGVVTAIKQGTTEITAKIGTKTAKCIVSILKKIGDIDGDNVITAYDAYKTLEISLDFLIGENIDEQIFNITDVDGDKMITANDAYLILKYSVGAINKFN